MNVRGIVSAGLFLAGFLASPGLYARGVEDALTACVPDTTSLCLNAGRFRVQTQWVTTDGVTGGGHPVALTSDTGYFWFFSANNVELVVKVVDGRAFNNNFWVFAGGLTNVNVIMTVTDTEAGLVKVYVNPQGTALQPIQDTGPFASPPAFDLTGTWSGPASDDSGPTTMTWTLTQSGGSITGAFFAVEPAPHNTQYRGTISGSLSGTSLTYTINVPKGSIVGLPNCFVAINGSAVASANAIVGTYTGDTGKDCIGPFANGLLSLAKQ
ncbi:MAG TPA: hypothetical protein VKG01_06415 [Thermoanaerobaculia bacterium]|nr:hypothetical protein [Thermoanaerobaculia bacterium]